MTNVCLYFCAVLVALIAALVAVLLAKPCQDWHSATCGFLQDISLCAFVPTFSRYFCGASCGWCEPGKSSFRIADRQLSTPRWHKIDRIPANTSLEHFERYYKKPGIPVIFDQWLHKSGTSLVKWDVNTMKAKCGNNMVGFSDYVREFLTQTSEALGSGLIRGALDAYLWYAFNTTLGQAIAAMERLEPLRETLDKYERLSRERRAAGNQEYDFRSLLHYAARGGPVNDFPLRKMCPGMWEDADLPLWAAKVFRLKKPCNDRTLHPTVFIESDGDRVAPAHQHGRDLTHTFQVLMSGAKKVVHWPYSERDNLSPVTRSITSENGEEVFMADGIQRRFDLFPAMAETEAWEGTFRQGDLLYLPPVSIHLMESEGTTVGVRFMQHDEYSAEAAVTLRSGGFRPLSDKTVQAMQLLANRGAVPLPLEGQTVSLKRRWEALNCE